MSFTDPFALTVSGTAYSLPLTEREGDETKYSNADGTLIVSASHDYGKRIRRVIRVDSKKISPDVFRDDVNVERSTSAYIVFDIPKDGYSPTEIKALWDGFNAALSASSGAVITKLLAGES